MEHWNVDFQNKQLILQILCSNAKRIPNNTVYLFSKAHYSSIPLFQHSNCELSEPSSLVCI